MSGEETFTSIHRNQLDKINQKQVNAASIREKLDKDITLLSYQEELDPTERDYHLMHQLKKNITQLESELSLIPDAINDYFLTNGELIINNDQRKKSTVKINKVSIQDLFSSKSDQEKKKKKMSNYKQFLSNIDPNYVHDHKEYITNENYCKDCNKQRIQDSTEARMICEGCGSEVSIILYADKPSLKDPPPDVRYYEYKRFSHYCDWLSNLQGNGNQVPEDVIKAVRYEIQRSRIKDLSCLNESRIKAYLKKYKHLGYDKYSNQATQILCRATGIEQTPIPAGVLEDLKTLFPMIQDSWETHKPKGRTNFSSYSYIIFKFCQLLGYKGLNGKLKLLKDKDTIYKLDRVWKKICRDMGGKKRGWEYIPTY